MNDTELKLPSQAPIKDTGGVAPRSSTKDETQANSIPFDGDLRDPHADTSHADRLGLLNSMHVPGAAIAMAGADECGLKRKTRRVAIYTRNSAEARGPRSFSGLATNYNSVDLQEEVCREFATQKGWTVTLCEHDRFVTGTTNRARPGLARIREGLDCREFDILLFTDVGRLARNSIIALELYEAARKFGVEFWTPEGKLNRATLNDAAGRAEGEVRSQNQATSRALRAVAKRGRVPTRPAYGYLNAPEERSGQKIHAERANVIREIARRYLRGMPIAEIVRWLNRRATKELGRGIGSLKDGGVYARPGGRAWSRANLVGSRRAPGLLRNPLLAGIVVFGKTEKEVDRHGNVTTTFLQPDRFARSVVSELTILHPKDFEAIQRKLDSLRIAEKQEPLRGPQKVFNLKIRHVCGGRIRSVGGSPVRLQCRDAAAGFLCDDTRTVRKDVVQEMVYAHVGSVLSESVDNELVEAAQASFMSRAEAIVTERAALLRDARVAAAAHEKAFSFASDALSELLALGRSDEETCSILIGRLRKAKSDREEARRNCERAELALNRLSKQPSRRREMKQACSELQRTVRTSPVIHPGEDTDVDAAIAILFDQVVIGLERNSNILRIDAVAEAPLGFETAVELPPRGRPKQRG